MPQYKGLLDMFDGGGAGRSGQTFEGGPLSGFLNALGIRPMGYMDRQAAAQPVPRPMMAPAPAMQPQMAPPSPSPLGPSPVSVQPMIGSLTMDDIMAAIDRGNPQAMPALMDVLEADRRRRQARAAAGFDIATMFPMAGR